jgi:predicted  nucleic acid-binding Zn-ribbon protein
LRTQKEQARLKETRDRIAEAHKEIGELRYRADGEERRLEELKAALVSAQQASSERSRGTEVLVAEIETQEQSKLPESPTAVTETLTTDRKPHAVTSSTDRAAKTSKARASKNGTSADRS